MHDIYIICTGLGEKSCVFPQEILSLIAALEQNCILYQIVSKYWILPTENSLPIEVKGHCFHGFASLLSVAEA